MTNYNPYWSGSDSQAGREVQRAWKVLLHFVILLGIAVLGTVIHETGHGATTVIFGGEIHTVAILPGIQLYPTVEPQPWSGWVARIAYSSLGNPWQDGLTTMMGSGLTALVGYGAIAVLLTVRPKGLVHFAWLSMAVLFTWDGLAYSVLPALGLKHWGVIGGDVPEPVIGATNMGITPAIYYTGLVLHVAVSNGLILYDLRQRKLKH